MEPFDQIPWGKIPNAPLQASPRHEQTGTSLLHPPSTEGIDLRGLARVCGGTQICRSTCKVSHTGILIAC